MEKLIISLLIFLSSCSQNPEYYYKRGNSFFMNGDYNNALDMYTKAVLIKPDYAPALVSRALTYERLNNKEKAKDDYLKAISLDKTYIPAYNNLASLLIESGLYNDALYYVNKAIEINPEYYYGYYNRGLINYYTGKYKESIEDFSKAISISPKEIAFYYRAMAYYKLSNLDNAINDLESIKNNSASDRIYGELGRIKFEKGALSDALSDINKAIELKEEPYYYFIRARINVKLNNMEEAKNDINKAIKLSSMTKSDYIYYAGDIYLHNNEVDMAEKYYNMALKTDPASKELYEEKVRKLNAFRGRYGRGK